MLRLRYQQIKTIVLLFVFRLLKPVRKRAHWVICERGTDARDNGYWFYRYMKTKHPEQKVYYIIDPTSADYEKVREDAVPLGSIRNYLVTATAEKIISTHYISAVPSVIGLRVFRLCGLHRRYYFLQHGVIKDNLRALYADCAPMCLFCCGAKQEYEYVSETFGHPEGVVQYTGLARFDQLHEYLTRKQILVMPTWRIQIRSEEEFLASDYYKHWQAVMEDRELAQTLKRHGVSLILYVHYEMQKYSHHFRTPFPEMRTAVFAGEDVQTLLKESAVLVTDYSSVFFDFAYMHKPVLYYQFDEEAFYRSHYARGYFDYRQMGFGPVVQTGRELTAALTKMMERSFSPEPLYLERMQAFFPLHDKQNCQRIYDAILHG